MPAVAAAAVGATQLPPRTHATKSSVSQLTLHWDGCSFAPASGRTIQKHFQSHFIDYSPLLVELDERMFSQLSFSSQARNKEHKPKLLSPDIFRWGRGLPREWGETKKFGMSLETREIKLFGRDIPGFCWDIPAVPEKFEKKKSVFDIGPLFSQL